MERIGILGGSFNPIHIGHLFAGRAAAEAFGLDRVLLLPCSVSPFKVGAAGLASGADRLEMVRLSVAGDPLFEPCGLEVERGGVSYAVDTVRALRARRPDARLSFIIGGDALRELGHWREIGGMLELCDVVTVQRPGAEPVGAAELPFPAPVRERLLASVVRGRLCDVSSTEIRRRVAEGRSIRHLVPPAVEAYIRERGLYAGAGA
ncbi:MAG: nicotinate-nucleotide adenylyltransferase [Verrucomicrobiota bacterium]|jgi:nicotinate-nucleotide adenylyltransferase|nr:nicotinate-nucleotide adenylyltransferase [Verrucomicrobiota bacterium]